MSLVIRLVPPDAVVDDELLALTGVGDTSGLGDSRAPMGEGDAVDGGRGESDGAGMTVTTADGEDGRGRLGVGEGLGLGLGLADAGRVGVGSGGMTPVGELDGAGARFVPVGDGFGAALVRAVGDDFGVVDGDGDGGAAAAGSPRSTTGVSTATAQPSSSDPRAFGTC